MAKGPWVKKLGDKRKHLRDSDVWEWMTGILTWSNRARVEALMNTNETVVHSHGQFTSAVGSTFFVTYHAYHFDMARRAREINSGHRLQ